MATHPFIPVWLHRTVKIAHLVNYIAVAITVIAYAVEKFGGIGIQFFLGCYQLGLAALATFAYYKWKIPAIRKLLKTYWAVVIAWTLFVGLLALVINWVHTIKVDSIIMPVLIVVVAVVPMVIALYFVYITYRIYNDFNQPVS